MAALSLVSAVFWRAGALPGLLGRLHALPGRLALRYLWLCVRLETIIGGIEVDAFLREQLRAAAGQCSVTIGERVCVCVCVCVCACERVCVFAYAS